MKILSEENKCKGRRSKKNDVLPEKKINGVFEFLLIHIIVLTLFQKGSIDKTAWFPQHLLTLKERQSRRSLKNHSIIESNGLRCHIYSKMKLADLIVAYPLMKQRKRP